MNDEALPPPLREQEPAPPIVEKLPLEELPDVPPPDVQLPVEPRTDPFLRRS